MKKICLSLVALLGFSGAMYAVKASCMQGQKAPLFTAKAVYPDGSVGDLDLQDYIGKTNIVLYFYPMDNTPGCSKQAQKFRDNIDRLKKAGITVLGVSCDSVKSHKKFQKDYGLNYTLLSDSRWGKIARKYGAYGFLFSLRKTFLINKKGYIIHVFDKVDIANQADEILQAFKKDHKENK